MRTKFWSDAIEAMGTEENKPPPNQPVAVEVARAVAVHNLSKEPLLKLVSGRTSFLSDRPFDSADDLDVYGKDTFASVNYSILEAVSSDNDKDEDFSVGGHARHAATQLGLAQAVVTLLRGVPFNASKRKVFLPSSLMAEHGVSAETVLRGGRGKQGGEGLKLVTEALAARAQDRLDNCRFRAKYLSRDQRLVMLPAVGVDAYLAGLHKAGCDVFDSRLQKGSSWLPAVMYYHKFRGTY